MKKKHKVDFPQTHTRKGKELYSGICFDVCLKVCDYIAERVEITDGYGDAVSPNQSVGQLWESWFTPRGWDWEIQHMYMLVNCIDGFCVIDVPMREYTYRKRRKFYWSGNKEPKMYFCETRNDIQECWDLTKEEATKVTKELQSRDRSDFLQADMTKHELWCKITNQEYIPPNQLKLL